MSIIINSELVRLLTAERIAEAQEARLGRALPRTMGAIERLAAAVRRAVELRSTPATCTCA